jgi:hypothetical protein
VAALWQNGWIDAMARGHKTGGRQKGTPNKATVRLDAKLTGVAERATADLSPSEIASMSLLDVMRYAMRRELEGGRWRSAASIAEKPPKDGSASAGRRRPRTHDQDRRRPAGVVLPSFRTAADRV